MASPPIISKLPHVAPTIFTVMSSMAIEYNAINLGQGFPDFSMSAELIDLVSYYMKSGDNQYAHMHGILKLREAIAEKVFYLYQNNINAESEITITPGGTYAIYTALTAVLRSGDEVIVFEPGYDSYIPNVEINGAIPVLIPMMYPDYKINWDEVRKKITPKTRMIMLNSPNNPTGSVLSKKDIEELRKIVSDTDIFILSDEVYEHLVFDGLQHESILRYPDLMERSFICFSFGKVYHCTGWKMGYCVAPEPMMKEFRKVHQFNCFSCNTPVQYALADFLKQKESYTQVGYLMQLKRDYFQELMKQTKFKPLISHGSYFQIYSYKEISDESEREFAIRITKEHGVVTIPVSAFYKNGKEDKVVRFCFSKQNSTLETAVNRLIKI
ncbi:MAG: methionine aminotransferase [Ginsengibacter sp.]